MEKEKIIIRIGGFALMVIGSIDIACGTANGPLILALPGAFFWLIGVLAMATGNM